MATFPTIAPALAALTLMLLCSPPKAEAQTLQFLVTGSNDAPLAQVVVAAGEKGSTHAVERKVMDQVNRQFAPYILPIHQHDTVAFPNSDQIRHHVYSFSPAKSFEIKLYHGEPTEPLPFDAPGAVVLGCNIHDNMVGYVFVTDRPVYAATDEAGQVTLEAMTTSIDVWHPALSLDSEQVVTYDLDQLERSGEVYRIKLEIDPPPENPQVIAPDSGDRFGRFKRN